MIEFSCPKCKEQLILDDHSTAAYARCPKCEAVFVRPVAGKVAKSEPSPEKFSTTNIVVVAACTFLFGFAVWGIVNLGEAGLMLVLVLVAFFGLFVLPAYVARNLAAERSIGSFGGFVLGIVFGWLGVVIVLLYPPPGRARTCPDCAEKIKPEARVCKHCGLKFTGQIG